MNRGKKEFWIFIKASKINYYINEKLKLKLYTNNMK